MNDEQFERQKEFILQQQAQFAARIGQLEDNVKRTDENVTRLAGVVEQLSGIVERVVDTVDRLAQATAKRLEAADRRTDEMEGKFAALVDARIRAEETMREESRKTEESVRNLAAVVERHIVEGHNGRARPEG